MVEKATTYIRDIGASLSDDKKIDIVFSYIRGKKIDAWVENYTQENFDKDKEKWAVSYAQFKKDLNARFVDANTERKAQIEIEALQQGKDTAEDFFQKFETLLTHAGYKKDDVYTIKLLELNVSAGIIDSIYKDRNGLPEEYEDWKKQILRLDMLWRCREEHNRLRNQRTGYSQQAPCMQHAAQPAATTPQSSVPKDRKDATGTTYGGAGKPMDIDNARRKGLCFHCGEQGHIGRFCPKKSSVHQVRGLWTSMNDDDRKKLAEELGFAKPQQ